MKTEKLVWGLILIFIGGIFLLENFDVIDFYWSSIWRFWPLILIVIGVNMLFSRTDFAAGPYLSVVLTALVLGFVFYQGITPRDDDSRWFRLNSRIDRTDWDNDVTMNHNLSEPWSDDTKNVELNIRGGATTFVIDDTTANLVDATVRDRRGNYTLTTDTDDSVKVINLSLNSGKSKMHLRDLDDNGAKIRLNTRALWSINVNVGAGETNFDLTPFKVSRLEIKGGVASFKARLGEPVTTSYVSANTGVSEVVISVPKTVGCQIKVNSGLSARDFEGFNKQSNGRYTTSNFNSSEKKIIIELKGGLSNFEVRRY